MDTYNTQRTKRSLCYIKKQPYISLRMHAVWSMFSLFIDVPLSIHWFCKRPVKALIEQTVQMHRLHRAFVARLGILALFLFCTSYIDGCRTERPHTQKIMATWKLTISLCCLMSVFKGIHVKLVKHVLIIVSSSSSGSSSYLFIYAWLNRF